ncbi:MAG: hypothetical protein ACLQU9_19355 [Acidimicrobiales bacterium]
MKALGADGRRRAARLLRWYPRDWRERYGDEFLELLVDDLEERPHSIDRLLDVARSGLVARLAAAGLGGRSLDPDDHGRRSLAAFACAVSMFLTVGFAIWAQLTIGWQWSAPDTVATALAMVVMTATVVAIGAACLVCMVPVAWSAVRMLVRQRSWEIFRPLCLVVVGLAVLIVGTHHFANGWPGTGGHPWAHQGIVPGGVAAYAWASTLFMTSYWLHPAALGGFPAAEVVWMLASPLALGAVVVGAAKLVRRQHLSYRVLRFERIMGFVVAGTMAVFLTGAALWVVDGGPGPRGLFHIGSIDIIELIALAASLALAGRAVERTGNAVRVLAPR